MLKILIDTSVQTGKYKYKEIKNKIDDLGECSDVVSSFYVLFEFRVGFILILINYWQRAKLASTPALAMSRWSESMKGRELKFFAILHAVISERFGDIPSDMNKYLRKIEAAIFYIDRNFFSGINKYLVGNFRYNEIIKFELNSSDNYYDFVKLCEKHKHMTDLREFWTKNSSALNDLVDSVVLEKQQEKIHTALSKIKSDIKYAYMVNTNRAVGDAVIATDMRKDTSILTTDSSFENLCKVLNKNMIKIPNKY